MNHPGELRAARAWAVRNEYHFFWRHHFTGHYSQSCTMTDNEDKLVGEWVGNIPGGDPISADEREKIESQMALEHMHEADVIPRRSHA